MRRFVERRALSYASIALMVWVSVGATCDNTNGPTVTVTRETRSSLGTLESAVIDGKNFTANGTVRINFLFRNKSGAAVPISVPTPPAREIEAGSGGTFHVVIDPMGCPGGAISGSWLTIIGVDLTTNKIDTTEFHPSNNSDCSPISEQP